jgi:8-oxo-dGTP pyrophosphatase MutT (NUDIX family)
MTPEENLEEIMTGDEPSNEATPEKEAPASTAPAEAEQPSEAPPPAETHTATAPVIAVKKAVLKKAASKKPAPKKAALKKAATKKAAVKSKAQKTEPKATPKPGPRKQIATAAPKKTAVALKSAAKATAVKAKVGKAKAGKPKADKPTTAAPKSPEPKAIKPAAKPKTAVKSETAKILESKLAYEGPLFRVMRDHIIEPGGRESYRDVIRHNGSVVILAVNPGKKKKDPWVVMERQYRHAAGQFLWELPAGKLDKGEGALEGARRELAEETGYQAQKWTMLVEYFASPGFLGESMKVFLAEGLTAGEAHPEDDEQIDFRLVKFSDLLDMVEKGKIVDGKTMISALLYARQLGIKRKR